MSLLTRRAMFAASDFTGGGGGGGSSYETDVLNDTPSGYWRLGESSGTTADDETANGYDGTYSGSPTLGASGAISGDADTAVTFDGTDDYVHIDHDDVFDVSTVTVEAWIKTTSTASVQAIFSTATTGSSSGLLGTLRLLSDGRLNYLQRSADNTTNHVDLDSTVEGLNDGNWHHVGLVITGSEIKLYADGVFVGLTPEPDVWTDIAATLSYRIGAQKVSGSANSFFDGQIDEVAVYTKVLTQDELRAHYYSGLGTSAPTAGSWSTEVGNDTPTSWWRFGESSGTTATDEQGNHDGTYSGVTLGATGLTNDADTAAEFDGGSDYVEVSDHADFDVNTFTVELWAKHDAPNSDLLDVLIEKTGLSSGNNSWGLWYDNRSSQGSPQRMRLTLNGDSVDWSGSDVATALTNGCHIVATKNTDAAALYVDGEMVRSIRGANNIGANSLPVRVGNAANSTSWGWDGVLDEVVFYSGVELSGERVLQHYTAGSS